MKKNILVIGGILALALLLVGAAFVGGRLLNGQGMNQSSGNDSGPSLMGPNGPISVDFERAKELPERAADVVGPFDHRQDKSIFVGSGRVTTMVNKNGEIDSDSDGPKVEVVVTSQTLIYKDTTMRQFDGAPADGQTIQQVLEPGSLDDISEGCTITAWGKKTGDRFIAEILVYAPLQ